MNIEGQRDYILSLLEKSAYSHEMRQSIEDWVLTETNPQILHKAIEKLKDNQLDRITSGLNYKESHISQHIKKLIWKQ
jgi:hypothetical protein